MFKAAWVEDRAVLAGAPAEEVMRLKGVGIPTQAATGTERLKPPDSEVAVEVSCRLTSARVWTSPVRVPGVRL
jgi:hypothetical protein